MGNIRRRRILMHSSALAGALSLALAGGAVAADQQVVAFDLPSQALGESLRDFYRASGEQIVFSESIVAGRRSPPLKGDYTPDQALALLLDGTNLTARRTSTGVVMIEAPQSGSAAGGGAEVEALIVTAQKREENIQDVPIAMSAFTQESLTTHQIAGGPDLMTQIPNFTFTKTNFTGYSITIRGIGTQAISATVDPAVAVAFNNTPFIRNRFFEQEFYDLNRVEVLRGPQGTLYGRNATAGVVNLLTARPRNVFEARLSADVGNYSSSRLEGMVNLPLVEDKVALRLAGAWTKRDGYVTNGITGEPTDDRDLWSVRATLGFEPTDSIRAYLTFEHFEEDDGRLRSGKQLCTKHEEPYPGRVFEFSFFSQGCQMGSLYDDEAFQVPLGFALPYYGPLYAVGLPVFETIDPYASTTQSKDLRVIETTLEPEYKAKTDIIHLAMEFDLTDSLTLTSETGYTADELFSFNDYNRFNTTRGVFDFTDATALARGILDENGVFCDPQLGCADRLVAADVSTARSDQFSQEFRLSSSFEGPFNFHIGANFLRYDTVDKYYVFINTLTMYGALFSSGPPGSGVPQWDGRGEYSGAACTRGFEPSDPVDPRPPTSLDTCFYIDPNPISSLDDNGRNYFLSKNPFRLISYAVFGEAVYNFTPDLKVTAGLRFTVDKKRAPIHPSWLLGRDTYGMPVKEIIDQEWREPTGRLVADWKPQLDFTDETLIYASYAHGYKAGGVNPPLPAALPILGDFGERSVSQYFDDVQPPEFGPEFVDAFEIGSKNTLLEGRLTANGNLFYYDYQGYQISQIANRSAVNLNFDAQVWGAEMEVDWRPLENLKIGFRGGYEKTRVGDGQGLIDMIDRTAGDPDWLVRRPFPSVPSNCIVPRWIVEDFDLALDCDAYLTPDIDPVTQLPYVPNPTVRLNPDWQPGNGQPMTVPLQAQYAGYPGYHPGSAPGGGSGIPKDVGGNELPNAPDFTATISIDYTVPLPNEWLMTLHGDFYRQSQAWTRIYNEDPYDRLRPYDQINLAAIFTNEPGGWKIMAYVKNALDADNITGAFLNSDDSGLTTNVFLNEPRLYGLRVTKEWTGQAWWTGGALRRHEEYPFRVEIGAGSMRAEADNALLEPTWADEFTSPTLPYPLGIQDEDLDWGDSREVRLIYAPAGGLWNIALGGRFGRTNGVSGAYSMEQSAGGYLLGPPYMDHPYNKYLEGDPNFTNAKSRDREEHTMVDFSIGRDVGMGVLTRSTVSAGLRYADLKSETQAELHGRPDSYIPAVWALASPSHTHIYTAEMSAERSFEGMGPMLSWEAAQRLFGGEQSGHLTLDWSLSAGVLFGSQEASIETMEDARYYNFDSFGVGGNEPGETPTSRVITVAPPIQRSDDVTVPTFGVSLGLSYSIDRVKISTGYRYDRFVDAIDGGFNEAEQFDRDIHGPFLKLSVGFGG